MSNKDGKNFNLEKNFEPGTAAAGLENPAAETLAEAHPAGGEFSRGVNLLAEVERLVSFQVEAARSQASRLDQAQSELVRVVGHVRELALTAADLAQKMPVEPQALLSDPPSATRGLVLLANILRHVRELSKAAAATIESQTASTGELVRIVGEAAKGSLSLAHKVSTLADELWVDLPVLSSKPLVAAEIECLSGELEKVIAQFQLSSEGVREGTVQGAKPSVPAKLPLVN